MISHILFGFMWATGAMAFVSIVLWVMALVVPAESKRALIKVTTSAIVCSLLEFALAIITAMIYLVGV